MRVRLALLVACVCLTGCPDSGGPDVSDGPNADVASDSPNASPTRKPRGHKPEGRDGKKGDGKSTGPKLDPPPGFTVIPAKAWARCNAGPPLKAACPKVLPKTKGPYLVESFGKPGGRFGVLEMISGAPRDDPSANAPPAFAHVVLEAGGPRFLIDFGGIAATASLTDSLLQQPRSGAVLIGKRKWGGREGRLLLAEPFPGGGAHGDHLVFQWRRHGVIHRISLHAWVPAKKSEKTLETIVSSASR
jgi:hypothetical protein